MDGFANSMMQWKHTFLDFMQTPGDTLRSPIPLDTASQFYSEHPGLFMPHITRPSTPGPDFPSKTASTVVSVSSAFFPGSHEPPSDRTLRSSDSVLFYVNSKALLKLSPHAFKDILGTALDDEKLDSVIVDIPDSASVLNIVLHAMYRLSSAKHFPSILDLETAVKRMSLYGLHPKTHISNSSPPTLFDILLSQAPLYPIRVYTLAAQFDIHDLAVKSSSHLLSYTLSDLTDEIVTAMGAVYLRRLIILHISLIDTLKRIILHPPPPHPATETCDFLQQKKLSRAWALASSYLAWDSRPDLPIHQLQNTLVALGDHLTCEECKQMLKRRVKEVVVQWVNVKRTI